MKYARLWMPDMSVLLKQLEFPMHHQSHTIVHQAVHLPDQQKIYFQHGEKELAVHQLSNLHT